MGIPKPEPVALSPEERVLFEQITSEPSLSDEPAAAAVSLTRSLLERNAIPKVRLRYFTDPELNIGGHKKSRRDAFEVRGIKGDAIFQHPNFLRYLKYFITGPDLPTETVDRFWTIVIDDRGTSGMVRDQLRQFARHEARRLPPEQRRKAVEEFFKLALECGLDVGLARSIRDAVGNVKW